MFNFVCVLLYKYFCGCILSFTAFLKTIQNFFNVWLSPGIEPLTASIKAKF